MTSTSFSFPTTQTQSSFWQRSRGGLTFLLSMVALMWVLQCLNWLLAGSLAQEGIRTHGQIFPDIWLAPLLHVSFSHLIGNTIFLLVLGSIIAVEGAKKMILLTFLIATVSGLGVWAFSPANVVTVGASGLVFGYAAFLLFRGLFTRNLLHIAVGGIIVALFGTSLLAGLEYQEGISWTGHAFGVVGGLLFARSGRSERKAS